MKQRSIVLLGASGNIGEQSLDIIKNDPSRFLLKGISVGHQISKIDAILRDFPSISAVCVIEEKDSVSLKEKYPNIVFFHGDEGLKELISYCDPDMVENALVGFAGLRPSIHALEENRILCLANKESLVVGGEIINSLLKEGKGKLYPIDSEHVAIAKCLSKVDRDEIERIIITASGGSFRDKKREELINVTPEMALAHPTWNMGKKITIDSATMMNKGFEVMEAYYLFHFPIDKIDVIIHEESCVHSLIELKDGTLIADVSKPDMHGPIEYALYEGEKPFEVFRGKTLSDFGPYHWRKFDPERYPNVSMAIKALKRGGTAGAILNGSNEEAVSLFLNGKLPFLNIDKAIEGALNNIQIVPNPTLEEIIEADALARSYVRKEFKA